MREPDKWRALGLCDAVVERSIAEGEYMEALDELVRGYQRVMSGFCANFLGDLGQGGRAQEVAQEVFLAAYQGLPRFEQRASVRTWLFRIARKRCLRELRDQRRRTRLMATHQETIAIEAHQHTTVLPEEELLSGAELAQLRWSLTRLKKRERELLMKRFVEGRSIAELAREYFRSERTIRDRLSATLEQLRTVYTRFEAPRG